MKGTDASDTGDASRDKQRAGSGRLSRRRFLATTAATGALALGGAVPAAGATVTEETCESFGEITTGDNFRVINNDWGTENVDMCTRLYDDGSYGWEWSRGSTDSGSPNYPQSLHGTKPWGSDTGSSLFPLQLGDVSEFEVALDIDTNPGGENWNLALEWWHTGQRPGTDVSSSITHEIMLVLEWGDQHRHGNMIEADAVTDAHGNSIDYWTHYTDTGAPNWSFHIFRIAENETPDNVDLSAIVDYLDQIDGDPYGFSSDLWVSGVEIGNEYWDDTSGETTFRQFDVTVNGATAESGGGSAGDSDDSDDSGGAEDGSDAGGSDGSSDESGSDDSGDGSQDAADGDYPTWDGDEIYNAGDRVVWNGRVWEAQWWTLNEEPRDEEWYVWSVVDETGSGNGSDSNGGSDSGGGSDTGGDTDSDSETGGGGGSESDDGSDSGSDSSGGSESDGGSGTDSGSDADAIAELDPSATEVTVGETVTFGVTDTSGSGRWVDSLAVDFGDGASAEGWWFAHSYDSTGTYTVSLRATDNEGATTTHDVTITVS